MTALPNRHLMKVTRPQRKNATEKHLRKRSGERNEHVYLSKYDSEVKNKEKTKKQKNTAKSTVSDN